MNEDTRRWLERDHREVTEAVLEALCADDSPLSMRKEGSLNWLLAAAFARELRGLQGALRQVYDSGFVDTAEGASLDKLAALLGLDPRGEDGAQDDEQLRGLITAAARARGGTETALRQVVEQHGAEWVALRAPAPAVLELDVRLDAEALPALDLALQAVRAAGVALTVRAVEAG